jgi:hypothetical protein
MLEAATAYCHDGLTRSSTGSNIPRTDPTAFEALSGMIAGTKYEIRTRFMIE